MNYGFSYLEKAKEILEKIQKTQYKNIENAAKKVSEVIENGHTIFSFGCSHAGMLSEELFYRTGGFAIVNPIFNPTLMLNTRPVTMTTKAERLEGFGRDIINESPLQEGDLIIIHSVSGRNPVPIDAAMEAKNKGAYVIAITNMEYSSKVNSRHSSGKRLFEVADLVIDNCGDFEDSSIKISGFDQKVGATSTIAGAAIVNAIVADTTSILLLKGIKPPIFHSANMDGGDEFNKKMLEKYKNRIHYM